MKSLLKGSARRPVQFCIRAETKHGHTLTLKKGFQSYEAAESYPVKLKLWKRVWVDAYAPVEEAPKTRPLTPQERIEKCFEAIVHAVISGQRCPENDTLHVNTERCRHLALAGRIKVEVFARNYRVVTILDGPHAGKKTAPAPYNVQKPKFVINKDGKTVFKMYARAPRAVRAALLASSV